jgi:hypothetical protein
MSAALWSLDYTFYCAQTNISRLYFHQGTGWKYSAWNPVDAFNVTAGVKGPYSSWLLSAKALSGGNKMIEQILADDTLTAYAVFDAGDGDNDLDDTSLTSLVIINMDNYETDDGVNRTYVEVFISDDLVSDESRVLRLSGPGSDVFWGITFAGQGVDTIGNLNGTYYESPLDEGKVLVGQTEVALVLL